MKKQASKPATAESFELIVLCWLDDHWQEYMRRGGLASIEVAEMLGKEEVSRIVWRTWYRRVMFQVVKESFGM